MRLLFISSFLLFPETRFGGSKRLYYFAREWARRARLTLIAMDGCAEWDASRASRSEFADSLCIQGRKPPGWGERFLRAPEDLSSVVASEGERIRAFLAGRQFDAVLLAFPWALAFLGDALKEVSAPVTYLEDDLSFERYGAEAAAARSPLQRAVKLIRRRQALAYYRPRLATIAKFVGISPQESEAMARTFPGLRRYLASYGIPLEDYPVLPLPTGGTVFGFIGNYGHPPNLEGLRWLAGDLASAIRAHCPGSRIVVAGKGIPAWAHDAFAEVPDVELRENVSDLRGFYGGITAFLNPIRTGRGLRTKLVEAAAFGRPIATTTLGGEGLEDLDMLVGDGTEGLAAACAALASDPAAASIAAARNRVRIEAAYDIGKVAADLLAILEAT